MNITIVVAKYKEDISWLNLKHFSQCKVIVYDKSPETGTIPNVGREAETFVRYIVENYDKLTEYTLFLQGNPFDHCPIGLFVDFYENKATYVNRIERTENLFDSNILYFDKYYENILQRKWTNDRIKFTAGAQYTVHINCIRQYSLEFWKRLHLMLSVCNHTCEMKEYDQDSIDPWTMERLWGYIFKID